MNIPLIHTVMSDWSSVYKHNGGAGAFMRCITGTGKILLHSNGRASSGSDVEAMTFSVVPVLTRAWSLLIRYALMDAKKRIVVGDCSGGYQQDASAAEEVFPIYNFLHGKKLDYFFRNVCHAEYVVISDDDIMWLSDEPFQYAKKVLDEHPECAVVSLKPRSELSSVLQRTVDVPLGSFCLVIRRKTWLREELSFQIAKPPQDKSYDWFYDTADLANEQLVKRGYTIDIAPEYIRESLVTIEGASTWTLKIHKYDGHITPLVEGIPVRQEKVYRVLLFLDGIGKILSEYYQTETMRHIIKPDAAGRALKVCEEMLPAEIREEIQYEISDKVLQVERRVREIQVRNRMTQTESR